MYLMAKLVGVRVIDFWIDSSKHSYVPSLSSGAGVGSGVIVMS